MDAIEQQEMPFPEGKKRVRRMRRGIFLLPSLLTGAESALWLLRIDRRADGRQRRF